MIDVLMGVAVGLMTLCAVLGWVFVALYSQVRWYASETGRHLMRFTVALSLVFSLSVLFLVVEPTMMTRAVLSVALFGWVAWELGDRIRLHVLARREVRREAADLLRNDARDLRRDGPRDKARDDAHDGR